MSHQLVYASCEPANRHRNAAYSQQHGGHGPRDAPPAPDSDVDSLSDSSSNSGGTKASSSLRKCSRQSETKDCDHGSRVYANPTFPELCSHPFGQAPRPSGYHSFPSTTKVAILDIVPAIVSFIRTPSLIHDCIRPSRAHHVLPIVEYYDLRDMHSPIASHAWCGPSLIVSLLNKVGTLGILAFLDR